MPRTLLADWCESERRPPECVASEQPWVIARDPSDATGFGNSERAAPVVRSGPSRKLLRSAGLAVLGVVVATSAILLQLKTIRVVTPVLLRDVVPLLADGARQRDLRADVACLGHCCLFLIRSAPGALSSCQTVGG